MYWTINSHGTEDKNWEDISMGKYSFSLINLSTAAVILQFQKPSALFASHLHVGGLEEIAGSQSSVLAYNPLGEPSCHAWDRASAGTNAVTRHAFETL